MQDTIKKLRDSAWHFQWVHRDVELAEACSRAADALESSQWRTGQPGENGRYIIRYRQHRQERTFVGDFDSVEGRWINIMPNMEILAWIPEPPPPESN